MMHGFGGQGADDRAGIGMRTFFERDQRSADLDPVADFCQQMENATRARRGNSTTAFSVSTDTKG